MDTVYLNRFSLEILANDGPVEKVIYKGGNYFSKPPGTYFKIRLGNDHGVRADAHVFINGNKVGIWRINPYSKVTIKDRDFVFVGENTERAKVMRLRPGDLMNGVIKVVFLPEKFYGQEISHYNNYVYNNSTHLKKTDPTLKRWKCFNNYTDTVTPSDKLNRRCLLKAHKYETDGMPIFGSALQSKFVQRTVPSFADTSLGDEANKRYRSRTELSTVDRELVTQIYVRLVADRDRTVYRRRYVGIRHASGSDRIPMRIGTAHPGRSNKCHKDSNFTLSQKHWFDNML